jgi:hypothetical protein
LDEVPRRKELPWLERDPRKFELGNLKYVLIFDAKIQVILSWRSHREKSPSFLGGEGIAWKGR